VNNWLLKPLLFQILNLYRYTEANYPLVEQFRAVVTARRDTLANVSLSTPIFISPPVYPFNFTTFDTQAIKYVNVLYPGYTLTQEVDLELVEWNPVGARDCLPVVYPVHVPVQVESR
jgi:hypothetical protein